MKVVLCLGCAVLFHSTYTIKAYEAFCCLVLPYGVLYCVVLCCVEIDWIVCGLVHHIIVYFIGLACIVLWYVVRCSWKRYVIVLNCELHWMFGAPCCILHSSRLIPVLHLCVLWCVLLYVPFPVWYQMLYSFVTENALWPLPLCITFPGSIIARHQTQPKGPRKSPHQMTQNRRHLNSNILGALRLKRGGWHIPEVISR